MNANRATPAVREATHADIRAIRAIDERIVGHGTPAERLARAIDGGQVAVAVVDGSLAGYARWQEFWDRIPLCVYVRVCPEHRRQGTGRALYAHLEHRFRREQRAFWLSSTEETNDISRRFHEALGFRRIGALSDLDQDADEIFYRKDLA